MPELQAIVAKRVKQCRQQADWTMAETVKRLSLISAEKITVSCYSNWESGIRRISPKQIIRLGQLFGKPAAWIQGFTDNDSLSAVSSSYVTANSPSIMTKSGLVTLTQTTDSTAYSLEYLNARGLNKNKLLSIRQLDKSMLGVADEGAEVLLDLEHRSVRGADLFGIAVQGNIWIRFIRPEIDGTFTLAAEARDQYPEQNLTAEQLEAMDIVGRVARIAHDR